MEIYHYPRSQDLYSISFKSVFLTFVLKHSDFHSYEKNFDRADSRMSLGLNTIEKRCVFGSAAFDQYYRSECIHGQIVTLLC